MNLQTAGIPHKCLVTMFLIVLSAGFFTAHLYLHHTVNLADGKETAFPTTRDITLHFHGQPGTTRLRNQSLGAMKKYYSMAEDPNDLDELEQQNLKAVLEWNDKGAPEKDYWEFNAEKGRHTYTKVGLILSDSGCFDCHTRESTMKGNKKDSPLDTYQDIVKFTKEDQGMSKGRLLMLSHVHLLGMSLMFLGLGFFLVNSTWSVSIRTGLVVGGFASILVDIGGWWAVKYGGGGWAWLVMAGGLFMGMTFGVSTLLVLFDLWFKKPKGSQS